MNSGSSPPETSAMRSKEFTGATLADFIVVSRCGLTNCHALRCRSRSVGRFAAAGSCHSNYSVVDDRLPNFQTVCQAHSSRMYDIPIVRHSHYSSGVPMNSGIGLVPEHSEETSAGFGLTSSLRLAVDDREQNYP
jgi:hypothetical protein